MSGTRHLEALALPEGIVRVYLTDFARTPLPLDDVHGTATIRRDGIATRLELSSHDGALEARATPFTSTSVDVRIEVVVGEEPLLIDFTVPVDAAPASAANVAR
jgi:hypothetical protein